MNTIALHAGSFLSADDAKKLTDAGDTQLIIAALLGIATVVILISFLKFP